jgi:iron complex transport system substrate-binding protein
VSQETGQSAHIHLRPTLHGEGALTVSFFRHGRAAARLIFVVAALGAASLPALAKSSARAGGACPKPGAVVTSPTGVALVCGKGRKWEVKTLPPVPSTDPSVVATTVPTPSKNVTTGCVQGGVAGVDQFPEKASIVEAKGLSITYKGNYKVVKVANPWRGAKTGFTYVLVQCGTPTPALTGDLAGASVIQVPVATASIMSTTLAPQFDELGVADRIISVDTPAYYSTPSVVKRIESGAVKGTGGGSKANVELLVSLKPGVVITFGTGSGSFDGIDKLVSAGLPTLVEAGYMEETPLGRSEWVKLIGALTNQEALAESKFARWRADYKALAAKVANVPNRPVVISGSMYQGTWYMPGGKSYVAQSIRDAGGQYPWASDTTTGSLSLDFEAVLEKGYDATVWINAGYQWSTLRDAVAEDSRYARLPSFGASNVYGNDKRVNATGGSDYYETAVVRPDLVLADLVSVLHPNVLPNHTTVWFRHIPRS